MAESISRRKYAKLVKFFTATMNDTKATLKMRYMAAQRLDDLYARNEARADRAAERKARAVAMATETAAERARREGEEAARAAEEAQEAAAREEAEKLRRLVDAMLHAKGDNDAA